MIKKILSQLNISAQCKGYGLPLWQCPQSLFLIMGAVIIATTLIVYFIGVRRIDDPFVVIFIILLLNATLFVISFIITKSLEKLAEASRLKTEFISVVSHQLRSPLSNLKWAIEFLMSGKLNHSKEKQAEYFLILKENNSRMEELISDLLTVSKIETKAFYFKKEEISLVELINELISEFKILAQALNVEIKFQAPENFPKILTDKFHVKMAIGNILDNAIRYTEEKGSVEIKLERKEKKIYFEIKDSGVGIPKEEQKYIFQKFFRTSNVMKQKTLGTGLGLYIVKSIIERAGGKINFKSQEGKGSTFWFTLSVK